MRAIITLLFTIAILSASAQSYNGKPVKITLEPYAISSQVNYHMSKQEAQQFFAFQDKAFSKKFLIHDRYLYTKDKVYYRTGLKLLWTPRTWDITKKDKNYLN